MSRATLSAVVPNYNHGHVLESSLRAILAQSRAADEVLVVDDGSTDNSIEVIEKICRDNSAVRLIRSDRNYGLPAALNRGLKEAKGEYICFPAADRWVLPGYFETSMSMLEKHPQAGLSCGTTAWLDKLGGELRQAARSNMMEPAYLDPLQAATLERSRHFLISDGAVIVKKSALQEIGGFDPVLRWSGCWFAYIAIGFRYGLCYLPDPPVVACERDRNSYSGVGARDREASRQVVARVVECLRSPAFADVAPLFRDTGILSVLSGRTLFLTDRQARRLVNFAGLGLIFRKEAGRVVREYIPFLAPLIEAYRNRFESKRLQAAAPFTNSCD